LRVSFSPAAHQGRAANTSQNCAGEPLDRDAAAIDDVGVAAVDGKRRLIAEIDGQGIRSVPTMSARPGLVQNPIP
jgi:hypothetical protein